MIHKIISFLFLSFFIFSCNQKNEGEKKSTSVAIASSNSTKVILITVDGLRWQELYTGADSLLVANKEYVSDTTKLKEKFWRADSFDRRKALMPFFWGEIEKMGQLHGNRNLNSKVNLTNTMRFSYPGYNEILTGKADDINIKSNAKINNPNKTILEIANQATLYENKVAAFGSWDVFPYIINEERSGVYVNAGFEQATYEGKSERLQFLNELQSQIPSPWGSVRLDAFTHHYAMEYMQLNHPQLLYIAYGETDDFAHDGEYDAYLNAAKRTDNFIKDLWNFTQNDAFYKNNTVFIIATDHGRGTQPLETWKHHGGKIDKSDETWLVMFGKNVQNLGEVKSDEQFYNNQIAPTILSLLNLESDSSAYPGELLKLKQGESSF